MASSLEHDLIQESLEEFRRRLEDKIIPLELRSSNQSKAAARITKEANLVKSRILKEFMKKVSCLSLERVGELVQELCSKLQKVIDQIISEIRDPEAVREAFLKNLVDDLSEKLRTSLEGKLRMNPEMDQNSIESFFDSGKALVVGLFAHLWNHENIGLYEQQKISLERKIDELREEMLHKYSRRMKSQPSGPVAQVADDEVAVTGTAAAASNDPETTTAGTSIHPSLPIEKAESQFPLVFRLSTHSISIGTQVGNAFQRLHCPTGELSIPPVVGSDEEGRLFFGGEALKLAEHWTLAQLLGQRQSDGTSHPVVDPKLVLGGRRMCVEFLLGLLLKYLKNFSESHLKLRFGTAVITVPIWLPSHHRIQVKNAGFIAGFSEVHLVNQESLVAYGHASRQMEIKADLLVLSENSGILSAVLYRFCSKDKTVTMVGHNFQRFQEDDDIKTKEERLDFLRNLLFYAHMNRLPAATTTLLASTESGDWMEAFKEYASSFGYQLDDSMSSSDMFGAWPVCEKNVNEIYRTIQEYLPSCPSGGNDDGMVALFPSKTKIPNQIQCELPLNHAQMKIFQEAFCTSDKHVILGQVEFKRALCKEEDAEVEKAFKNCKLILTLEITSEAVLTLKQINVEKINRSEEGAILSPELYEWKSSNLSDEEVKDLNQLVNSTI